MKKKILFVNALNFLLVTIIVVLLGIIVGIFLSNPEKSLKKFVYKNTFESLKKLEDIQLVVPTTLYDDSGNLIKEFAIEKRKIANQEEIPEILKNAIIVAEDKMFYSHWGINIKGVIRAVIGVLTRNRKKGGGSSITQQLVLNLFLKREITFARKFKEMLLAIQVERNYTKDEILTYYCNKIFLGRNIYGVKSAYAYYFGKQLNGFPVNFDLSSLSEKELKSKRDSFRFKVESIADAAFIAGIIPSPNNIYDLDKNPENCLKKRNLILTRLLTNGFIDSKAYQEAKKLPLPVIVKNRKSGQDSLGSYFLEEVRKQIENRYGGNTLYKDGLKVYTTINMKMQKWAEQALRHGLRLVDKRKGWKSGFKLRNLLKENRNIAEYQLKSWDYSLMKKGEIVEGIVLKVNNKRAIVRIGIYEGILYAKDAKWTRNWLSQIIRKGDVVQCKIDKIPQSIQKQFGKPVQFISDLPQLAAKKKKMLQLRLDRYPKVQGAIVVLDNKTGKVKAMVGGFSFSKSKWNNATQAKRQVGSTVKPFIYTAALHNGYTPATIIDDEPFRYEGPYAEGVWEPQNHADKYLGPLTFRRALEKSKNVVTARITERMTPDRVLSYIRRFSIGDKWMPYMSISLGAFEESPLNMAAAYTVYPNLGKRVEPYFVTKVTERNNSVIERNEPQSRQVLNKATAYVMNYILQGVVQSGTGVIARKLALKYDIPIAAKTGTTNEYTNAWIIGFTPNITVAVWVGYDKKIESLGKNGTGSEAAGPILVAFLGPYLKELYEKDGEILKTPKYRKPQGVIMTLIDKYTGKLKTEFCKYAFLEAFLAGKEPSELCNEDEHDNITDYYSDEELKEDEEDM